MYLLKFTLVSTCILLISMVSLSQEKNVYKFKLLEVNSVEESDVAREKMNGIFQSEPKYNSVSNLFEINSSEMLENNTVYDKLTYLNLTVTEFHEVRLINVKKQ